MFELNPTTGTITCFKGDSGKLHFKGEHLSKYDLLSFSVYNTNRTIAMEHYVNIPENATELILRITPEDTDKLTVKKNEDYAEYFYSVKLSKQLEDGVDEDTFLINGNTVDDPVSFIVYPKRTEGYPI